VPCYAKLLKELYTTKGKLKGNEKLSVVEDVSTIFQKKLSSRREDPSVFSIPCKMGNICFNKAKVGLTASINIMPRFIYDKLNLEELKKTGLIISQLYPYGVLWDVLVQVSGLIFFDSFYVLDMIDTCHDTLILLDRPFLKTYRTKVEVDQGTLTMQFHGEVIKFKLLMP